MMNTNQGDALTKAYEMIEADKLDDAKAILRPILETDRDNPDAWWLYAHAVTDSETARIALNNVLRIDSEYPEAAGLLKTLEEKSPSDQVMDSQQEPSFLPAVPASLPDLPKTEGFLDDIDLSDDFKDKSPSEPVFKRPAFLIGMIAVLLILAIIIVVVRPFGGSAPASNIISGNQATLPPSTASDITPLAPTLGAQSVGEPFTALRSTLASFTLADNGINITNTSLGNTILVSVCTTAGRELRALLPQVMDALAKANGSFPTGADAVAVRMTDCQTKENLLTIGVPVSDTAAYTNGSLSEQDFQARWKPIQ
jgi:hypothetical protein